MNPKFCRKCFCELDRLNLILSSYDRWQKRVLLIPALRET